MDALVDRWKNAINSADYLRNSRHDAQSGQKDSSMNKTNPVTHHSHYGKSTKKSERTPPGKRQKTRVKSIEYYTGLLCELIPGVITDKVRSRVVELLEYFREQCKANYEEDNSVMRESNVSSATRLHEKLYKDLYKKYFECEKYRQYFKNKSYSLTKKYEGIDKYLDRYSKIERLIDNSIEREADLKKYVSRLRRELYVMSARYTYQQRIFRHYVMTIHYLINSIKNNLPNEANFDSA